MGSVGQGVEEEIRERIAGEMLWVAHPLGEYHPLRRDTMLRRKLLYPGIGLFAALEEPQHAVRHMLENEHPALERERGHLLHAIEAAIDHAGLGQADVAPGWALGGYDTVTIIRLIARQPHDLFRVVDLVILRHDILVRDDVMVIGTAHCAREPEPVHCDAGRALGEYSRSRILCIAVEVDQDIDVVSLDAVAGLLVVEQADVEPMLRRCLEALLRRIRPQDPAVISENLEILAIV